MKHILLHIAALTFLLLPVCAQAAKGAVVYRKSGCDYYIVETSSGYALLEWYGGNDPSVGDVLTGMFETYGMKDIYNITADSETKIWVEDFWLSKDRAIEKFFDKCH